MMLRSASNVVARSPLRWQREVLHAAVAFMEAVWCIPIFIAFAPGASRLPTPIAAVFVIVNLLAAMGLVRFLTLRHVPYQSLRWMVLAGIVAATAVELFWLLPINPGSSDSTPLIFRSFSDKPFVLLPLPVIAV